MHKIESEKHIKTNLMNQYGLIFDDESDYAKKKSYIFNGFGDK